ncbi:MAG: hypothetical protein CVU56_01695 [Deltaproteobacteria bacterium HGW-Deltaproteobacteria-14]|jgi:hypothetical protein|nr:MAG: hypothetical protein CVU56_01695 [Deltaproteobacteria bacterium HGW-Deltaproteobacteria-14]
MPPRPSSALAVVAVAAALTACGEGDPATCGVPNATQACACPDGSTAGQTCQLGGAWTACGCANVDPQACEVGGVGVDAGCRAGEWCAPGRGSDAASPGCTTIGTAEIGRICHEHRCEDTAAEDCYLDALCPVGAVCDGSGVCAALCDPAAASCGPAMACTAATDGGATLPYGTCDRARCEHPFRAGECGPGAWCSPNWLDGVGGSCVATGDAATGEPCGAGCAANNLCNGGFCEAVCAAGGAFPDAPSCAGAMVCAAFGDGVSLGTCRTPCEVGADTCPAKSFCDPPELSLFDTPVCSPTPSSWPDDGGLAPGEDCTGARCGPLTSCFGVDEDQNGSVDFSKCYGRCRTGVAPFGADHPDCPAAAPDCVDAVGDPALGACLPKG